MWPVRTATTRDRRTSTDSTGSNSGSVAPNSARTSLDGGVAPPVPPRVPVGGVRVLPFSSATAPASSGNAVFPVTYDRLSQPEPSHEDAIPLPPYTPAFAYPPVPQSGAAAAALQHAASLPLPDRPAQPQYQGLRRLDGEISRTSPPGMAGTPTTSSGGAQRNSFNNFAVPGAPASSSSSDPLPAPAYSSQGFLPRTTSLRPSNRQMQNDAAAAHGAYASMSSESSLQPRNSMAIPPRRFAQPPNSDPSAPGPNPYYRQSSVPVMSTSSTSPVGGGSGMSYSASPSSFGSTSALGQQQQMNSVYRASTSPINTTGLVTGPFVPPNTIHPIRTASLRGRRPEDLVQPVAVVMNDPFAYNRSSPPPPSYHSRTSTDDDPIQRPGTGNSITGTGSEDRRSVASSQSTGGHAYLAQFGERSLESGAPLPMDRDPIPRAGSEPMLSNFGGQGRQSGFGTEFDRRSLSTMPGMDELGLMGPRAKFAPPGGVPMTITGEGFAVPDSASWTGSFATETTYQHQPSGYDDLQNNSNVMSVDAWASEAARTFAKGNSTGDLASTMPARSSASLGGIPPRATQSTGGTLPVAAHIPKTPIPFREASLPKFTPDEYMDQGIVLLTPNFSGKFDPDEAMKRFRNAHNLASTAADLFRETRCLLNEGVALLQKPGRELDAYRRFRDTWDMLRRCILRSRTRTLWIELADSMIDEWEDQVTGELDSPDQVLLTAQSQAKVRKKTSHSNLSASAASFKAVNKGGLMAADPVSGPPVVAFMLDLMINLGNASVRLPGKWAEAVGWWEGAIELSDRVWNKHPGPELPGAVAHGSNAPSSAGRQPFRLSYIHRHTLICKAKAWTHIGYSLSNVGQHEDAISCHNKASEVLGQLEARLQAACTSLGIAVPTTGHLGHPIRTTSVQNLPQRHHSFASVLTTGSDSTLTSSSAGSSSSAVTPVTPPREVPELPVLRFVASISVQLKGVINSHLASAFQGLGMLKQAVILRKSALAEFLRCGDVLSAGRERMNVAAVLVEWGRAVASVAYEDEEISLGGGGDVEEATAEKELEMLKEAGETIVVKGASVLIDQVPLYNIEPQGMSVKNPVAGQGSGRQIIESNSVNGLLGSLGATFDVLMLPTVSLKYVDRLLHNSLASIKRAAVGSVDLMERPPKLDPEFPVLFNKRALSTAFVTMFQFMDQQPSEGLEGAVTRTSEIKLQGLEELLARLKLGPDKFSLLQHTALPPRRREAGLRMLSDLIRAAKESLEDEPAFTIEDDGTIVSQNAPGAGTLDRRKARQTEMVSRASRRLNKKGTGGPVPATSSAPASITTAPPPTSAAPAQQALVAAGTAKKQPFDEAKMLGRLDTARMMLLGAAGLFSWISDEEAAPQWERDLRTGWTKEGLEILSSLALELVEMGEAASEANSAAATALGSISRQSSIQRDARGMLSPTSTDPSTITAPPRSSSRRRRKDSGDSGVSGSDYRAPTLTERLVSLCETWFNECVSALPTIVEASPTASDALSTPITPSMDVTMIRLGLRAPFMSTSTLARLLESIAELAAIQYPENPFSTGTLPNPMTTLVSPLPSEHRKLLRRTAQMLTLRHTVGTCRKCLAALCSKIGSPTDPEDLSMPTTTLPRNNLDRSSSVKSDVSPPGRLSSLGKLPLDAALAPINSPTNAEMNRARTLSVAKKKAGGSDERIASLLTELGGVCQHVDLRGAVLGRVGSAERLDLLKKTLSLFYVTN